MKLKNSKKISTIRIISITLFATSVTIALFIVFFTGFGILLPFTPLLPTITNKPPAGSGGYLVSPSLSNSSSSIVPAEVSPPNTTEVLSPSKHEHAALMVFINGNLLNFSHPKYQNQDLLMHFEAGDGFTIHKHAKKSWLGPFFESLNIALAQNCLVITSNRPSYCSNFDKQISLFVNGKINNLFQHYVPRDGDRILLTYGSNKQQIDEQQRLLNSVSIASK